MYNLRLHLLADMCMGFEIWLSHLSLFILSCFTYDWLIQGRQRLRVLSWLPIGGLYNMCFPQPGLHILHFLHCEKSHNYSAFKILFVECLTECLPYTTPKQMESLCLFYDSEYDVLRSKGDWGQPFNGLGRHQTVFHPRHLDSFSLLIFLYPPPFFSPSLPFFI